MPAKTERTLAIGMWAIVAVVGAVVLILVAGLHLQSRLSAGQSVLDGARPAFTDNRVAGDRVGINMASSIVDLTDPIMTAQGGAGAEVPKLLAFVSGKTGLSQTQVLGALTAQFPHTAALLQAIPLDAVAAEGPALVSFLSSTLNLTPDQVLAALQANFPHLAQSIVNLPVVTGGWNNVPGTDGLTRFDGTPVRTVPDVRTYFSADVIAALEAQKANFQRLDTGTPAVGSIAPLLLIIGGVVLVFGVLMMALSAARPVSAGTATASWSVVVLVGIVVLVLVLPLGLFPRLYRGQDVLDATSPAFSAQRVAGDRASINFLSSLVDLSDPIVTAQGGGAGEVPKLVTFVSSKTGLSSAQVLGALQKNFPHTTALLLAIPLESVTAELPGLTTFLSGALQITPAQLQTALATSFPHIAQALAALPTVTGGWNNVPGTENLTRFDATPVRSVPDVRTYFSKDVIPVLETQQANFTNLVSTSPQIIVFPPLLTIVGAAVVIYGLLMIILWRGVAAARPPSRRGPGATPTPVASTA